MGATSSRFHVEDFTENANKNIGYYDGTRFFTVPREHYSNHTRGWLYGWYVNEADP